MLCLQAWLKSTMVALIEMFYLKVFASFWIWPCLSVAAESCSEALVYIPSTILATCSLNNNRYLGEQYVQTSPLGQLRCGSGRLQERPEPKKTRYSAPGALQSLPESCMCSACSSVSSGLYFQWLNCTKTSSTCTSAWILSWVVSILRCSHKA